MSLRSAYIGVGILETTANYATADAPLTTPPAAPPPPPQVGGETPLYDDGEFWRALLKDPERYEGAPFYVPERVPISQWVARVPGLYWQPGSAQFREVQPALHETLGTWQHYAPLGKSQKVLGGVGTLRLPAGEDGRRLISLAFGLNASAGVPALVSPEVWDVIRAAGPPEGRTLSIEGRVRWQAMAEGWSRYFQATRDLPRGYMILDRPDAIRAEDESAPVRADPFSVMEYEEGGKELFSYVYAAGDTTQPSFRGDIAAFVEAYRTAKGRHGCYLLETDLLVPMWGEVAYNTPAELRHADEGTVSQLELVAARVREHMLGQDAIDRVLEALSRMAQSVADLETIGADIGAPPEQWRREGASRTEAASYLVDAALRQNQFADLIAEVTRRWPALMQ